MTTRYTARILKCDTPMSITGNVYQSDEVKRAIKEWMAGSERLGVLGSPTNLMTDLDNVSHKVIDTWVDDDGWWCAEIETLATPRGKTLEDILESGIKPAISHRAMGRLDREQNVCDIDIAALDVTAQ